MENQGVKRIIIVPGNGCTPVEQCNWYYWLKKKLTQRNPNIDVVLKDMPDPHVARKDIWLPFILNEMGANQNGTIIIGHSSGAVAAMRLLEENEILGVILVATCHTDLGDANERASGYFSDPWKWDQIQKNSKFIVQMHSQDDPLIPVQEARYVKDQINSEYIEFKNKSHFFEPFPELLEILQKKIDSQI